MLHNLLDHETKKELRSEYYARLLIVATLLGAVAIVVGGVASLPAYIHLKSELRTLEDNIAVASSTAPAEDVEASTIVTRTNMQLTSLEENVQTEPVAELLEAALVERPEGVTVTGFSFDREKNMLTIEGVAKDRDIFRLYSQNLEANERFADVPQPISNLIKNTDLPFRLSFQVVSQGSK